MTKKLFKSIFALAMVVGSALGFVACEDKEKEVVGNPSVEISTKSLNFSMEEGSESVSITSNSDWKTECDADWVTVTPAAGNGNGAINVAVALNDSGEARETTIKVIALHPTYGAWDTKKITVKQSGSADVPVTEELLYSDNFDGKEAVKEYGSGSSWPYIDQFPEFANPEGPAAENVTYSGSGVSVRANSTSNSSYSDYAGSGSNNIFFGGGAYFQVNDIALDATQLNYKMTFGTEKYTMDGDSTFKNEEFLLYISKNGQEWAPVEYTYAGTEPGRWNVATTNFTLAAGTEVLYVKFEAKVASVYRLDDVKLYVGNGGQTIDLDDIQIVEPEPPTTDALYFENFDGKGASKDSNGYWPYIADFPEMKNAAGAAAANVSYEGYNTTVRNNSNSDGSYSDYAGSGVNNIFFGKDNAWIMVKDLALESSQKNLTLTFGTEKYSQSLGSVFTPSEFIVTISGDGEKWSNVEYTFAGTAEGRWNVATANFTLKEVPAKLYIKFMAKAESAYRLDDVTLNVGEGGQVIDLGEGISGGDDSGDDNGNEGGEDKPNTPGVGKYESDSAFVCSEDNSTNAAYTLGATTIGSEAVTGFKLGKSKQAGKFTSGAVGVEGTKYLNFYAQGWKGGDVTLYFRVDGGATQSVKLASHDGVTGNPPFTALAFANTDHYSIELTGLTASSKIEFATDANFALTTADSTMASARAIMCGVKLTDEALTPGEGGGNEGGNENPTPEPEPEPTPDVKAVTVAEFLAAEEGSTIYELTGVIKNVANTNYGNFDLQDETGTVYVYGIYDESGNKVFTSLGLKEGDTLTMRGVRTSYQDNPQVGSGVYVSHVSAPEQEQPANEATLSFADVANRVSWDSNKQVWSANGITLTNNKGASTSNVADYSAPARFYKSSEIIVECEKAMTKIEFACNSATYAAALQASLGSTPSTIDGSSVIVEFDTATTSFTIASLTGGQVRMNSLTVTFAE